MSEHALNDVLATTMEKIKSMVDVNAVIGTPISTPEGITIIPVSKVTFGFASGGSDFGKGESGIKFGGGAGAGATITPEAFLIINGENVRLLPMTAAPNTAAERIIEMVPGFVEKISDHFKKDKEEE